MDDKVKMTRLEVLIPEDMRPWMRSAARRTGQSESGYLRLLIANDLTSTYGSGWLDHPGGDLESDDVETGVHAGQESRD